MLIRYLIFVLIQDKSIFWTLIAALLGIAVTLVIVGIDYRNEYHSQFMWFSLIIFAFSGAIILLYFKCHVLVKDLLRDRFRSPVTIGILHALVREPDTNPCQFRPSTQNFISEQQWHDLLTTNDHYQVRIISVTEIDDTFSIILNPFGEAYPEEDTATRQSFHRIADYIKKGGIFVNTTGIAFYYMWDSATGRDQITGEPLETYQMRNNGVHIPVELAGQTSVSRTWMRENFGIRTTIGAERNITIFQNIRDLQRIGDLAGVGIRTPIREFRAALYGRGLIPLIRGIVNVNGFQTECYPLAASRLGIGYLIVSGFTTEGDNWTNLIHLCLDRLCDRIMSTGSIE